LSKTVPAKKAGEKFFLDLLRALDQPCRLVLNIYPKPHTKQDTQPFPHVSIKLSNCLNFDFSDFGIGMIFIKAEKKFGAKTDGKFQ